MDFDLQPTLTGDLIQLRPLTSDDFEACYEVGKDPLIWEQHAHQERYKPDAFRQYFDGGLASGGALVVLERATGRVIGCTRYSNLNEAASEIEIGWTFLDRAFWGQGHNREMKSLMLDHAFRYVERVVFVVAERNIRSQKAVEKIGARFLRREERSPGRPPVPFITFVISRSRQPSA